ncbi:MAG TPA: hypothetical protein VEY12_04620 [Thermoplasmata archaeon]|nr:hypothetical protein [Thermoplasmata archaeon]
MTLTRGERVLYQQIHPAKLATDWGTTLTGTYLLWEHELLLGLAVVFIPAIAATALIAAYADLKRLRDSPFGAYVRAYMSPAMQGVRALGAAVMLLGAWFQVVWAHPLGVVIILLGWFRGILQPTDPLKDH